MFDDLPDTVPVDTAELLAIYETIRETPVCTVTVHGRPGADVEDSGNILEAH